MRLEYVLAEVGLELGDRLRRDLIVVVVDDRSDLLLELLRKLRLASALAKETSSWEYPHGSSARHLLEILGEPLWVLGRAVHERLVRFLGAEFALGLLDLVLALGVVFFVTRLRPDDDEVRERRRALRRRHFTFSSSYTRGGEALAFGSTPRSGRTIVGVFPESKAGYIFDYDYTNKKLRPWQANYPAASAGALTEVPNATNLSAVTDCCLVVTL